MADDMIRFLLFLFVATGVIGAILLLASVFLGNETVMRIGLGLMLGSAVLAIAIVIVGRTNGWWRRRGYHNTLPH